MVTRVLLALAVLAIALTCGLDCCELPFTVLVYGSFPDRSHWKRITSHKTTKGAKPRNSKARSPKLTAGSYLRSHQMAARTAPICWMIKLPQASMRDKES